MADLAGTGALHPVARLPLPRLHLITDRMLARERSLVSIVALGVAGGVGAVHLREKDLGAGALLALARELRAVSCDARLLVNDRVDVALAIGADGVQLPGGGLPVEAARQLLGAGALIGCSVHSVSEARAAAIAGADFVLLGAIFATESKPGRKPAGLELIRAVRAEIGVPSIAIGGVNHRNAALVLRAGAYGVAVRGALLDASDPREAARRLADIITAETS